MRVVRALLAPPSPARRRVGMQRQRLGVAGKAGAGASGDSRLTPLEARSLEPCAAWRCAGSSRASWMPRWPRWFGRFPARREAREDTYLLDPQLRGLSVKVRGGGALEVKVYRGSPGILEVAGRARGRMESWQKWSFPFTPLIPGRGEAAGWRQVHKRRRISRFSLASGPIVARGPGLGQPPQCEVELTEIRAGGQHWWTLGFEATGPADRLRSELQATTALVFAHALPGGVEPGPDESRSYAQWLGQRP